MLDRDTRQALEPQAVGDDDESWLTSYLDVLTLLITLFVLLLALTPKGGGEAIVPERREPATPGAQATNVMPRGDGLKPAFDGLNIPGVKVNAGNEGVILRIDDSLLFASAQAQLTEQGEEVIKRLVEGLSEVEGRISIEGHTDAVPIATTRFPSNWELSTARAIAVVRYLSRRGIDSERMRAVGYADTQPLASNETAEGRATNRRVELLLRQLSP